MAEPVDVNKLAENLRQYSIRDNTDLYEMEGVPEEAKQCSIRDNPDLFIVPEDQLPPITPMH